MIDPSQFNTALQALTDEIRALRTSLAGNSVPGPAGEVLGAFASRAPGINVDLPNYWPPEFFANGSRLSTGIIDLGDFGNACIVYAQPDGSSANPQCTITVVDAPTPGGPFLQGVDDSSLIQGISKGSSGRYIVTSLHRYVKLQVNVTSGTWRIGWAALQQPSPAAELQGWYPVSTTGTIAPGNVAQLLTINLGTLQGGGGPGIFDAKQALVTIANVGTGQSIANASLIFTDTTPGGVTITHTYPLVDLAGNLPSIGNNASEFFLVSLSRGIYKTVSLSVTFSVAPVAGQVDVQLLLQSSGGLFVDPTAGIPLIPVKIDTNASGVTRILTTPPANFVFRVVGYSLVAAAAVTAQWQAHTAPTQYTGAMSLITGVPVGAWLSPPAYLFQLPASDGLDLNLGGAVQVSGHLTYYNAPSVAMSG